MNHTRPNRPARIGHATAETIRYYAHTWYDRDGFTSRRPKLQRAALSRRGWFTWDGGPGDSPITTEAIAVLRNYDHDLATGAGADWYANDAQRKAFNRRHGYEPSYSTDLNKARLAEIIDSLHAEAYAMDPAAARRAAELTTMHHIGTARGTCFRNNCPGCKPAKSTTRPATDILLDWRPAPSGRIADPERARLTALREHVRRAQATSDEHVASRTLTTVTLWAELEALGLAARWDVVDCPLEIIGRDLDEAMTDERYECTTYDVELGLTILCSRTPRCRIHLAEDMIDAPTAGHHQQADRAAREAG
jgi:hypothetical protein